MAITLRSSAEARNAVATTHTVTTPAGAASGDVLYGIWFATQSAAWTVPAGWTSLINVDNITGSILVCRLVLSGSPDASYAATTSANETSWGLLTAWTGADTTTPEDVAASHLLNSIGTYTTPSLTTATDNAVLLCFWAQGANLTIVKDAATTAIDDGASSPSYAAAYEARPTAGATGTRTATGMTNANVCASVAIRPAAVAATPVPNAAMLMGIGI